jgi:hypothetical protein
MFVIPLWLTLLVAGMVILFGGYRIKLAFRSKEADEAARKKKGLYGLPRRTHALIGGLYVILGVYLILGAFGIAPIGFR